LLGMLLVSANCAFLKNNCGRFCFVVSSLVYDRRSNRRKGPGSTNSGSKYRHITTPSMRGATSGCFWMRLVATCAFFSRRVHRNHRYMRNLLLGSSSEASPEDLQRWEDMYNQKASPFP